MFVQQGGLTPAQEVGFRAALVDAQVMMVVSEYVVRRQVAADHLATGTPGDIAAAHALPAQVEATLRSRLSDLLSPDQTRQATAGRFAILTDATSIQARPFDLDEFAVAGISKGDSLSDLKRAFIAKLDALPARTSAQAAEKRALIERVAEAK